MASRKGYGVFLGVEHGGEGCGGVGPVEDGVLPGKPGVDGLARRIGDKQAPAEAETERGGRKGVRSQKTGVRMWKRGFRIRETGDRRWKFHILDTDS